MQVASALLLKEDGTIINGGPIEVNVNEPTTLTCKVLPSNSKPPPTIVWYIGSVKIKESTDINYTFTPPETDNNKMIYCEAYNLQSASEAVNSAKPSLLVRGNGFLYSYWCLTRDQRGAGSSLTSVTVLCPYTRHINPSLVLVHPGRPVPT